MKKTLLLTVIASTMCGAPTAHATTYLDTRNQFAAIATPAQDLNIMNPTDGGTTQDSSIGLGTISADIPVQNDYYLNFSAPFPNACVTIVNNLQPSGTSFFNIAYFSSDGGSFLGHDDVVGNDIKTLSDGTCVAHFRAVDARSAGNFAVLQVRHFSGGYLIPSFPLVMTPGGTWTGPLAPYCGAHCRHYNGTLYAQLSDNPLAISPAGTITVTTNNIAATFIVTDDSGHTFSGSGTSFTQTAPPRAYTINYGGVIGLTTPPTATASLGAGGTITFKGIYICEPPPGHAPFVLQVIPNMPGFDSCPPKDSSRCTFDAAGNCLMNAVSDDQGNQFQLWCMTPALPNHLFSWYGLFYLPVDGTAKFAGKCPYEGGQDQGIVYYSAPTELSQPSCFVRSQWQVVDGGFFDDELLYVPWVGCPTCKPYSWVYDFDVATRMTTSTHINPAGIPIGTAAIDPLPDFNNLPPVLDLSAIPSGGAPMGLTKPGDVNVDGQVDCTDVKIERNALGTKNGDFGFAPGTDINRDGAVDINDLATVIQNFTAPGTTCPSLITFQILLDDINVSVQLGLIDANGIANSLTQKISAASGAAMSGQAKTATSILNAFRNEVEAQTNKHILPPAAAVLTNDAASLISQIDQKPN